LPVPVVVTVAPCGDVRGTRFASRSRPTQPHQAPPPRARRPLRVMHRRAFSRAVFRYPARRASATRGLVGRPGSSLCHPTALMGFRSLPPFAGLLPRIGGHHVSVRPGPRAVRASSSAPIIFVGVAGCSPDPKDRDEAGRPGASWRRLPGFAPMCGPPPPLVMPETILPWAFASCRVGGHDLPCSRGGHVPAPNHQPPGMSAAQQRGRVPLSARGLCDALPVTSCVLGGSA